MEEYRAVYEGGSGEIIEKKSRFIANIVSVASEEEALDFINQMKKKYWDARHNCSAYIIGTQNTLERCNDDGEPSRTAGMPMLEVLKGAGLYNTVAVVTRYFGGTLLGTGGLVRAYQGAVQEGLKNCRIIVKKLLTRMVVTTDYSGYGRLQFFASQEGIQLLETEFTDKVTAVLMTDERQFGSIEKRMTEATAGKAVILADGKFYCAEIDGCLKIFDM